eukprot:750093-Amphidinium_carterae.5
MASENEASITAKRSKLDKRQSQVSRVPQCGERNPTAMVILIDNAGDVGVLHVAIMSNSPDGKSGGPCEQQGVQHQGGPLEAQSCEG